MNITAKSKYAVRGLVELAQRSDGRPVPLGEVAESRGIPARFLEQLFATLRKGGVLCSERGARGGFRFDRPAERVTVLDVVRLLDGPLGAALCTVSDDCELRPVCAAGDVWLQAKLATEEVLAGTTIQDLAEWEKAKKTAAPPGSAASPAPWLGGDEGGECSLTVGRGGAQEARKIIRNLGSALVAFSGGVDSTVLLGLALEELGSEHVLAATAHGDVHTTEELETARQIAAGLGARHMVVETRELLVPGFAQNPPDRCFLCRSDMYGRLWKLARAEGLNAVIDGANRDDGADYRPGMQAAKALGVRSPLAEAALSKDDVRALARELELPNWDRPASPCLSSRFPYGEEITAGKLAMVEAAERCLRDLGFPTARVRHHGELARVEVPKERVAFAAGQSCRNAIVECLQRVGYAYVTLDLQGFRSGSMNETLGLPKAAKEG